MNVSLPDPSVIDTGLVWDPTEKEAAENLLEINLKEYL